jgi:hypothetical protein
MTNKDDITPLRLLLQDLLDRKTDPGEIHVCPLCQGILHVRMSGYTQVRQTKRFAAYVRCENCKVSVIFELGDPPPWIKERTKVEITSIKDALKKLKEDQEE